MKRKAILILVIGLIASYARAQFELVKQTEQIEPSNEALAQIKSIVTPYSLSTGVHPISIPVYSNREAFVNLSLAYHSGGIKVAEKSSSVGLGWNLEGGGIITRIVRGNPDDSFWGYIDERSPNKEFIQKGLDDYFNYFDAECFVEDFKRGVLDPTQDIFFYKFPGNEGKFFFDHEKNVHTIPKSNLLFDCSFGEDDELVAFTITTPNGVSYIFDKVETTIINRIGGPASYNTAWFLSQIKSSQIVLIAEYEPYSYSDISTIAEYKYTDNTNIGRSDQTVIDKEVFTHKLTRLAWHNGSVNIAYKEASDFSTGLSSGSSNIIDKITIYPQLDNSDYYSYTLLHSNFNTDPGGIRYDSRDIKLDAVEENKGGIHRQISFNYDPMSIPLADSKEQDMWGYYNANEATTLVPYVYYKNGDYSIFPQGSEYKPGADRTVNESTIQAGQLKQIVFPEGKVEEFEFEPNRFRYRGNEYLGGGLRLFKKSSYVQTKPDDKIAVAYYYTKAFDTDASSGELNYLPNIATHFPVKADNAVVPNPEISATCYWATSMVCGDIPISQVAYSKVYTDTGIDGYIEASFEKVLEYDSWRYSGHLPDLFPSVFSKDLMLNEKHNQDYFYFSLQGFPDPLNEMFEWGDRLISEEILYDSTGGRKRRTVYNYGDLEQVTKSCSYKLLPGYQYSYASTDPVDGPVTKTVAETFLSRSFMFSAWKSLLSKRIYAYDDEGVEFITSDNSFNYTSSQWRFLKEDISHVDDKEYITRYSYPFESIFDNDLMEDYKIRYSNFINDYMSDEINYIVVNGVYYPVFSLLGDVFYYDLYARSVNGMTPELNAIAAMRHNHQIALPITTLRIVRSNDETWVTGGNLNFYKVLINGSVKQDRYYEISEVNSPYTTDFEASSYLYEDKWQIKKEKYDLISQVTQFDNKGFPVETRERNDIPISFLYSNKGETIVEAYNLDYESIKDITDANSILRSTYPNARIKTYFYHPRYGKVREIDSRGKSTYYIYDITGRRVAIKDNEQNIVHATLTHSSVWGSYQTDGTTDPNQDEYAGHDLRRTSPQMNFNGDEAIFIHELYKGNIVYNANLTYTVDFGDGHVENLTSPDFKHKYESPDAYNVVVTCQSNGVVLEQSEKVVDVLEPENPLVVDYVYRVNIITVSSIPATIDGNLSIELFPEYGTGEYSVSGQIYCNPEQGYPDPSTLYGSSCKHGENVVLSFTIPGTYSVTCSTSDGINSDDKVWHFTINKP